MNDKQVNTRRKVKQVIKNEYRMQSRKKGVGLQRNTTNDSETVLKISKYDGIWCKRKTV